MQILFAADAQPYSAFALAEVTLLALNTWADVTIIGVAPEAMEPAVAADPN